MYSWGNYQHHVESVYNMVPPNANRGPRYVSKYADKVREDFYRNKQGLSKTIGQAVPYNKPHHFLKKHTRCLPTFHNQKDRTEACEHKESAERFIIRDPGRTRGQTQCPPSFYNQYEEKSMYTPVKSLCNIRENKVADKGDNVEDTKGRIATLISERKNTNCHPIFPHEMGESYDENQENVRTRRLGSKNESNCTPQQRKKFSYEEDEPGEQPCTYNPPDEYVGQCGPDFIEKNALKVLRTLPSIPKTKIVDSRKGHHSYVEKPFVLGKNFGRVPAYLQRRKCEEQEREMQLKKDLEASRQRECREIGADERRCIIHGLEQKHGELTKEYFRLPMTSSIPRVLQRRNEIEVRLEAIRKDLILFKGSKKIFVSNKYKSSSNY